MRYVIKFDRDTGTDVFLSDFDLTGAPIWGSIEAAMPYPIGDVMHVIDTCNEHEDDPKSADIDHVDDVGADATLQANHHAEIVIEEVEALGFGPGVDPLNELVDWVDDGDRPITEGSNMLARLVEVLA